MSYDIFRVIEKNTKKNLRYIIWSFPYSGWCKKIHLASQLSLTWRLACIALSHSYLTVLPLLVFFCIYLASWSMKPCITLTHSYRTIIFLLVLRYESSTLVLCKELSSTIFQSLSVSPSVRHAWHLPRSPLCAIYKGIDTLYWPSVINYQLLPPHSVLYWPSTQLHYLVTHSWANWI